MRDRPSPRYLDTCLCVSRGTDVDEPRNLAKSVTVEYEGGGAGAGLSENNAGVSRIGLELMATWHFEFGT